ncbi:galactokinase [Oleiharenicola sp. Vm1]|uniref:galactokinase n=1 Tax=Oleiharenicola sp. Vm1 TaxID=3398393 RepID=UPI0039F4907E
MNDATSVSLSPPDLSDRVCRQFEILYRRRPVLLASAPGRVNVIGEHVDYNGGWVLPAAIDRRLVMAVAPRNGDRVRLATADFEGVLEFGREDLAPGRAKDWSRYVRGVIAGLAQAGHVVPGFDACVASSIPVGGGLSSSAALEAATGLAGLALAGADMKRFELAKLCQQAEHTYAGVPCGIMDQAAVLCCERGHLLLLDCEAETFVQTPLASSEWSLLIINSGVAHELASGEYARRREACEQAARRLRVPSLRHIAASELDTALAFPGLTEEMRRCVRHVVSENVRTLSCVEALRQGDFRRAGQLLNASHASLRDDYRVSCAELDFIAETAQCEEAVAGCRMTGGGFGGSCVALVRGVEAEAVMRRVSDAFHARFGHRPAAFVTPAAPGAQLVCL